MISSILSVLLAAQAAPSAAPRPVPAQTLSCPIGGASFQFSPAPAPAALVERPDGRPYGKARFPQALPECPDNGLVLYKEYEADEVARLKPLVKSEAYQGLRKSDTQYYRAYWLMREMGVAPERYLLALLRAGWEAEEQPELRRRYLAELADESAKLRARSTDLNWIGMEGRAINALRELGRFDEASERLAKVPLKSLEASGATAEAKTKRGWLTYFGALKTAIARKDSAIEPLDMLPRAVAVGRCLDQGDKLDAPSKAFCERETAAIEELRAARAKFAADEAALARSRDASGR
jgi:hypothetical protein